MVYLRLVRTVTAKYVGYPMSEMDDPVIKQVVLAQSRHTLFALPQARRATSPLPVVVGVSGGGDSVALLHVLHRLASDWKLALHVAHLDHGLRPESTSEACFVAELAHHFHLPFHHHRLTAVDLPPQTNLEAAARHARYSFLAQVAQTITPDELSPTVAVAHHADDQAETVLLNLLRGSGATGLAAMRWVTRLDDFGPRPIRLLRPFLALSRQQICSYLQQHALTWREDASNQDRALLRNRLRHEILPQLATINPNLTQTLGRTAQILAGDAERLERLDRANWDAVTLDRDEERMVMDGGKIAQLPLADRRGVLRLILDHLGQNGDALGFDQIDALARELERPSTGGPHPLPGGLAWSVHNPGLPTENRVSIHRQATQPWIWENPLLPNFESHLLSDNHPFLVNGWQLSATRCMPQDLPHDWQYNPDPWQAFLDGDRASSLRVQPPHPGMSMVPLGMARRRKLVGDIFTDQKIPTFVRATWPVLVHGQSQEVLWLCGLRVAHEARISPTTQSVVWLRWQKERGG